MEDILFRVVDVNLDTYILSKNREKVEALVRGNVKKSDSIIIGDVVKVSKTYDKYIIEKVLPRKNQLIRPRVSNIDNLVIVVSLKDPEPDYVLLDKQLILCFQKNITPIIVLNKCDLVNNNNQDIEYIKNIYGLLGIDIVVLSAKENIGTEILREKLNGKISAFSGNSGVGKSSIIKLYIKNEILGVGDVAKKTKRGRHTTKKASLFEIENNTYILDTPGFSSYELYDIEPQNLRKYYPDFCNISCKYYDCNHINEDTDICNIKNNVKLGNLDKKRYERYVFLYTKLKEIYDRRYK